MQMDMIIKIIGIVFVLIAVLYILRPDLIKRLCEFFKKGIRIYLAAVIRFALAVLFFIAARDCKNFWVIFAFGALFLVSGLLIVALGPAKIRPILQWYQKKSSFLLRLIALVILAFGIIIIIYA